MRKIRYPIMTVMLLCIFLFVKNNPAFSIDPGRICLSVGVNEKIDGEYTVRNTENIPIRFSILKKGTSPWLTLQDAIFTLNPNESKKISYSVYVTNQNLKGEQVCRISVGQIPSTNSKAAGAGFETRMSLPVYIFVKDTQKLDANVSGFECNGNFEQKSNRTSGMIGSKALIKNIGNIHFICEPFVMIYKIGEGNKKELVFAKTDPQTIMVFPNEERKIEVSYNGLLEPGDYECQTLYYFKMDNDIKMSVRDLLSFEKCSSIIKKFRLNPNGDMLIEP